MIYFCCQSQRECPPVAPQHLVFTFFPSDIASLGYCLPSLCFDKSVWNMCTCLRTILNVCVCVCVWPSQPINTALCLTIRCSMPPAMAPCPKDLHRVLEDDLSSAGTWVLCPAVTGHVVGRHREASKGLDPAAIHNQPVCQMLFPYGGVLSHHSQERPPPLWLWHFVSASAKKRWKF